ncbi:MAG: peroxiredoxin family protein [Blastocatellia bacterium]
MTKHSLVSGLAVLVLALIWSAANLSASAQSERPTRLLRQFQEAQLKLQNDFDRDVNNGKAQPFEWESRSEGLKKILASKMTGYRVADWKGEDLLSLYSLYLQADLYAQAIEAGRVYLKSDSKSRFAEAVRNGVIRSLIELEQVEEAQKLLDELFQERPETIFQVASRIGLYRAIVLVWRNLGRYDMVAKQAGRGFDLKLPKNRFSNSEQRLSDNMLRDRLSLAADFVSAQERLMFKKEADAFHKRVLATEFEEQAVLQSFYESELAAARLLFTPAPELDAPRWISSEAVKIANLKGKVVLLDFWAMWCSQCTAAFPEWRELQKKYAAKGLEIIGITSLFGRSDSAEGLTREQELNALRNFKTKHQLNYPLGAGKMDDVTNNERYGIANLPTVVLIDRRGNIRHFKTGVGEYRKLEKVIEKLLAQN